MLYLSGPGPRAAGWMRDDAILSVSIIPYQVVSLSATLYYTMLCHEISLYHDMLYHGML